MYFSYVESPFESQAADVLGNQTQELSKMVSGSEKVLEITLDSARNRLMRLNLFVTTGSFIVGSGALAAGLLGLVSFLFFVFPKKNPKSNCFFFSQCRHELNDSGSAAKLYARRVGLVYAGVGQYNHRDDRDECALLPFLP